MIPEIEKLKLSKIKLADEGFHIIGIFGSCAREDFSENSDIDILYEIEPKFIMRYGGFGSIEQLEKIKCELKQQFGREIDLAAKNSLSNTAQKYILRELVYV